MRNIIICLAVLIIAGCKAQTPPMLDSQDANNKQPQTATLTEIQYKRQSRGLRSLTTITPKKLTIATANKKSQSYTIPKEAWDSLSYYAKKIKPTDLSKLEAPTEYRTYDGAAAATLTLVINKKSWPSAIFDDGYPPKEIEDLVNKLLSLEERYVKD